MNQMTPPELVTTALDAGLFTLTLGNGKAHPLSLAMIKALQAALDTALADDAARVILLHGPGSIFCAGHDLKEIARHRDDADEGVAFLGVLFDACAGLMLTLAQSPKPVITLVEGIATAAGCQMVASSHMAFAAEGAQFQLPGVNNGGFCTTPAVAVSRAVARKHLMELVFSGEMLDTDWALRAGLINRVLPAEAVEQGARTFAAGLAARNPGPIQAGIATINRHQPMELDTAYGMARDVMISHFMDPGRREREKASKFSAKA
ncbi:enoyl-CoA hydratase-related protein [Pseudooceanicola sp.]|uniref:enoyl-CoA hydratase-related protein n=1 Tax=Pseudooceanicola sp. TaxID=1914328 RepID=UPI0026290E48|nr:enoyl-CoA hydratase-related protein [Pseudooceanicola sp.]MDF1853855.1 enoyl-CoA hydratase-related protein [Pseudooceanicola sp.]